MSKGQRTPYYRQHMPIEVGHIDIALQARKDMDDDDDGTDEFFLEELMESVHGYDIDDDDEPALLTQMGMHIIGDGTEDDDEDEEDDEDDVLSEFISLVIKEVADE